MSQDVLVAYTVPWNNIKMEQKLQENINRNIQRNYFIELFHLNNELNELL